MDRVSVVFQILLSNLHVIVFGKRVSLGLLRQWRWSTYDEISHTDTKVNSGSLFSPSPFVSLRCTVLGEHTYPAIWVLAPLSFSLSLPPSSVSISLGYIAVDEHAQSSMWTLSSLSSFSRVYCSGRAYTPCHMNYLSPLHSQALSGALCWVSTHKPAMWEFSASPEASSRHQLPGAHLLNCEKEHLWCTSLPAVIATAPSHQDQLGANPRLSTRHEQLYPQLCIQPCCWLWSMRCQQGWHRQWLEYKHVNGWPSFNTHVWWLADLPAFVMGRTLFLVADQNPTSSQHPDEHTSDQVTHRPGDSNKCLSLCISIWKGHWEATWEPQDPGWVFLWT